MNKQDQIDKTRDSVYYRDQGRCQRCFKVGNIYELELAHRMSRSVKNKNHIRKFWLDKFSAGIDGQEIDRILNHEFNLRLSCSKHNQSFLIDGSPEETKELLTLIAMELNYGNGS